MSMKLRPLADLVIVEEVPNKLTTPSGLLIPADSLWYTTGRVQAIGPDVQDKVQPGEIVMYNKKAGAPLDVPGERVINIKEVVGVMEAE